MKKLLAISQIAGGGLGILLVLYLYASFAPQARSALDALDEMAVQGEDQVGMMADVLRDYQAVLQSYQEMAPSYRETIKATQETSVQYAALMDDWSLAADEMFRSLVAMAWTLERLEQVKTPDVDVKLKHFVVKLPNVVPTTTTANVPYPTAKVDLTRPDPVQIGRANLKVKVPGQVKIELQDHRIDYPEIQVHESKPLGQQWLEEQKAAAILAGEDPNEETPPAQKMRHAAEIMGKTRERLVDVAAKLRNKVQPSLEKTQVSLTKTESTLATTIDETIPQFVRKLYTQKRKLDRSRQVFAALEAALIPATLLLAIIPACFLLAGIATLVALRDAESASTTASA